MQPLLNTIAQLQQYLPSLNTSNNKVSSVTVGWHIQHSLLTINAIINALSNYHDLGAYKPTRNFNKFFVLTFKTIPKGKAKAPKHVQPVGEITQQSIATILTSSQVLVKLLEHVPDNAFFAHPMFGHLNKKLAVKFMLIHTQHHIKIIKHILN